jgi:GcrA cell cycle regulator
MTWTDEKIKTCVNLWLEGLSSSLIAARTGISRNAVIGKMHRMGLAKGTPGQARVQVNRSPFQRKPGRPKKPRYSPITGLATLDYDVPAYVPPPPSADDVARVSFENLEPHHCRFIPGEVAEGYCGLTTVPGHSYCATHLQRCYTAADVTRSIAAHDKIGGSTTAVATVQEFLEPA